MPLSPPEWKAVISSAEVPRVYPICMKSCLSTGCQRLPNQGEICLLRSSEFLFLSILPLLEHVPL